MELEAQLTGKAPRGRARHVARYRQLEKLFWWSAAGPGRPTPDVAAAPALLATAKNNRTVHSWVNDVEFLSCTRDHMPFVLASFAAGNLRPLRAPALAYFITSTILPTYDKQHIIVTWYYFCRSLQILHTSRIYSTSTTNSSLGSTVGHVSRAVSQCLRMIVQQFVSIL